jgi:DNA-binding LytR/AlgR family response regulator
MAQVKIGIVEDEMIIASNIKMVLSNLGYLTTEPAFTYNEAIEMIEREKPDLLLLDIQLIGQKSGIDLAWKVKEEYNIPFIFLTSNADKQTIAEAKRVRPPAYLVKPFNKEDLYAAIEIALFNFSKKGAPDDQPEDQIIIKKSIFIKEKNLFVKLPFTEITFLQKDHVYIDIHTLSGRKYVVRNSLEEFCKKLPKSMFYRVHRSYVINLEHIESINSTHVYVMGEKIIISKSYRDYLLQSVNIG